MLTRISTKHTSILSLRNFRPMSSYALPLSRPVAWKSAAPPPLPGPTFGAQPTLQKLPVPELKDTLTSLKETLKPISWNDTEYADATRKIDDFGAGIGPELHKRLLNRHNNTEHWLEEWWDDAAYLGYRDSIVVNVSYYYGFDAHPSHLPQTPAHRAASLIRAAMIFRKQLKCGTLPPDKVKEGPLCMDTFRWMFDCCRVPGSQGLDWGVSFTKEGDTGDSGHIVVFRKNRPWKVDVTRDGTILSTSELERQIQHIYDNTTSEYPGVGILTASNRDVWVQDYATLSSSPSNASVLQVIHSAAFTLSLESDSPTTEISFSRALWHGHTTSSSHSNQQVPVGLRNRWCDKPIQFIVFDNMQAGLMGEHSVMDGTPVVRLCDDVLEMLASPTFDHGSPSSSASIPNPLDWKITPDITAAIYKAEKAAANLIDSQVLGFLLTKYGKAAIKEFNVSPDSWAQMIVQLAYRRLIGTEKRVGGTYEAATTRRFYKGRTEAIRVVSAESDAWVQSMLNEKVGYPERKRLFGEAVKKHVEMAKMSGKALGVDRHLFGLKKLLKQGEEVPSLFNDPVLLRSSHWALSTSAVFSKHFPVYGWGEVVPDGFGVAYMTGYDDRLQYTITSRKEMPNARFCEEIAKAADDLYDLHAEGMEGERSRL